MSNSPSTTTSASAAGSSKPATTELRTSKATSNSKNPSDSQAVAKLLEGVPTWNPDEGDSLKRLLTARKKALGSLGLGNSDNHLALLDSVLSSPDSGTGQPSGPVRSKIPNATRAIDLRAETLDRGSLRDSGATSRASTSSAKRARANQRSSTTHSGTKLFTLSQVSRLSGSIGMPDNQFSSLMSLKDLLSEKLSYASWMAIHTTAQSKATSSALNGLLSCLHPMSTSTLDSIPLSSDDSTEEDSSVSQDNEEIMGDSLTCSEELSASEDEYRYSKRARQQAKTAWVKSIPSPYDSEDSDAWALSTESDNSEEFHQDL